MENVKTYEEWSLFKKELSAAEVVKKQEKEAQKEREKMKKNASKSDEATKPKKDEEKKPRSKSSGKEDPYGEEYWEDYLYAFKKNKTPK